MRDFFRDGFQEQWRNQNWSCTGVLVLLNAVVYLVFQLLPIAGKEAVIRWFALSREGVAHGAFWQFFTYQFLHETFLHLLLNMLALWFVGQFMERALGLRRFLILYLLGGAVGGGLQLLFQTNGAAVLVGASAAVCAVLVGFCTLYPQELITALIFFIIPVQLRAKTLGWGIAIVSLALALVGWPPGIGNLAHFGGCLLGFLIIRLWIWRGGVADLYLVAKRNGGVVILNSKKLNEQKAQSETPIAEVLLQR